MSRKFKNHIKYFQARNKNGQTDLSANFTVEQVPKNVKDMAMNWFLKLSEIIDIPIRFYSKNHSVYKKKIEIFSVECSMIACLKFFDAANLSINLERLAIMCSRGFFSSKNSTHQYNFRIQR